MYTIAVRGHSQIMSATLGGEGVWQMLKLADKGGRSGLANDDGTDKNYQ